jgi:hypothetical protein
LADPNPECQTKYGQTTDFQKEWANRVHRRLHAQKTGRKQNLLADFTDRRKLEKLGSQVNDNGFCRNANQCPETELPESAFVSLTQATD